MSCPAPYALFRPTRTTAAAAAAASAALSFRFPSRTVHTPAMALSEKLKPAARVSGQRKDVW